MTEQKYRAVVRTAGGRQMYGTLTDIQSAREEITATFTEDHIERPVPTTDEPKQMLMTHPHDGHGPDDTCLDCAAACGAHHEHRPGHHESPPMPTREQIAEARDAAWQQRWDERVPLVGPLLADEHAGFLAGFDAAVALLQKGADRG